jgi:CRISPR-associated protein Csd1
MVQRAISATGDGKDIPAPLSANILRAALTETVLPPVVLTRAIERYTRSLYRSLSGKAEADEKRNNSIRLRLIRAAINRSIRLAASKEESIPVNLDKEKTNPGYLLGRLFAVLERIQSEANPQVSTTIRTTSFQAAYQRPAAVFPRLFSLSGHHLKKIRQSKGGLAFYFEREIGEIMGKLPETPAYLSVNDQGQFLIGYQHQRWAKAETTSESKEVTVNEENI